ncbi:MAG TPA: 4-(cytidine 5'-diphospho)-2-C-methyl-D-erythritol kinase [Humisphaera sp.]|jgi:4-diphosphocytidyl-2-C-methyl-D-erythritol kinase|nr:4-(cytidine 5'-diphospho)-2-C-methyl-D-erythritol kinase [Humisphaera sp.]
MLHESAAMRLLAPAKINLHLRVGPPRSDGFHPLLSWFCTIGLFDILTFETQSNLQSEHVSERSPIELTCDRPDLPCDQRNLVVRVTEAWATECATDTGARIDPLKASLQKRIPAGAGLGGGSSDGATALLAVNHLWNTGAARPALASFAARFGSDLSFFFFGSSSVCKGRGEIVTPIARPTPRWAMLILPAIEMPTPRVYKQFDAMNLGRIEEIDNQPDWNAWTRLGAARLMPLLVNDLEPPAFAIEPALGALRRDIEQSIGQPVRMSGSGSSLFSLFDSEAPAEKAARDISEAHRVRAIAIEMAPVWNDDLHK